VTEYLLFQLQGAQASWGDVAVGEMRATRDDPGASALVGLLGAALGIERTEDASHAALCDGYAWAVGTVDTGSLLRDYHTAQVPARTDMKRRPHRTRRDELAMPRRDLHTVLSTRDYRQCGSWIVAAQARAGAPQPLSALAEALREPRFVLYLGRKSCPPCAPLAPTVLSAPSALSAMQAYLTTRASAEVQMGPEHRLRRLTWTDGIDAGTACDLTVPRKDRLIRRRGWQFGDRTEHVALFDGVVR
jgi:CRISPR system Cascade subunit CasD